MFEICCKLFALCAGRTHVAAAAAASMRVEVGVAFGFSHEVGPISTGEIERFDK